MFLKLQIPYRDTSWMYEYRYPQNINLNYYITQTDKYNFELNRCDKDTPKINIVIW